MQQRERFGAACLALCLKHDAAFRRVFLERVCRIQATHGRCEISVDPYREGWADILLDFDKSAIVIECKFGDDVMPKQNPWHKPIKQAFGARGKGYGWHFRRAFSDRDRFYVLLTATTRGKDRDVLDTHCRTATWGDVFRSCKPQNPWVRDFYLSLANLNYPEFRRMKATDLHISDLDAILQCHEVLAFVAGQLGLSGYKIVHEAEKKDVPGPITSGYIGIEITDFKRSQKHAASIQQLIKPPAKYQAWFGYNFENSSGKTLTNLSVWFYCGTSNARKTVQKKLGKRRGWKLVPMESDAKPSDKYFLQYSRPAAKVNKDCEAFLAFIAPVIPEVETGG